jgi:hypothetical protein
MQINIMINGEKVFSERKEDDGQYKPLRRQEMFPEAIEKVVNFVKTAFSVSLSAEQKKKTRSKSVYSVRLYAGLTTGFL